MKEYTRADFFLELSGRAEADGRRQEQVSRDWLHLTGAPSLLATLHARLAGWLDQYPLDVSRRTLFLFASDSAVMEEGGLSNQPDLSPAASVRLLAEGRHPANLLAQLTGTRLVTVDLGTPDLGPVEGIVRLPVMEGGANNFLHEEAMTEETMMMAVRVGMELVSQAQARDFHLLAVDSLSESSQLAAAAMLSVLLGRPAEEVMERGPGLPDPVFDRRGSILNQAIRLRAPNPHNTFDVLRELGCPEIAAMTGFFAGAALYGIPLLIGGSSALTAALTLVRLIPETRPLFFAAHAAPDPGGEEAQRELGMTPVIDDRIPATVKGSALYLAPLLDLTCALYNELRKRQSEESI